MTDHQAKYLSEVEHRLRREGFTVQPEYAGLLPIEKDSHRICNVNVHGNVSYDPDHVRRNGLEDALDQVRCIADETLTYMKQLYGRKLRNAEISRAARVLSIPCGPVFPCVFPLQVQKILHKALHALCAVLLHGRSEVGITVQGKGGGGVAQVALDSLDIVPGPDRVHGVCMAAVMEARTIQPCGVCHGPETVLQLPLGDKAAGLRGENQTVAVVPKGPGPELVFHLPPPLGF